MAYLLDTNVRPTAEERTREAGGCFLRSRGASRFAGDEAAPNLR